MNEENNNGCEENNEDSLKQTKKKMRKASLFLILIIPIYFICEAYGLLENNTIYWIASAIFIISFMTAFFLFFYTFVMGDNSRIAVGGIVIKHEKEKEINKYALNKGIMNIIISVIGFIAIVVILLDPFKFNESINNYAAIQILLSILIVFITNSFYSINKYGKDKKQIALIGILSILAFLVIIIISYYK